MYLVGNRSRSIWGAIPSTLLSSFKTQGSNCSIALGFLIFVSFFVEEKGKKQSIAKFATKST